MPRPDRPPLQPVTDNNGHPLGWCAATDCDGAPDDSMAALLADIIRRCADIERLQEQHRQAVRDGLIPPCPWDAADRWLITDRD